MMTKRFLIALLTLAILSVIGSACIKKKSPGRYLMRSKSVEQVFDTHRDKLLSMPGVVGAGIAKLNDRPCIVVMVKEKTPELENQIPTQLEGYSVIIEETGEFKAQER